MGGEKAQIDIGEREMERKATSAPTSIQAMPKYRRLPMKLKGAPAVPAAAIRARTGPQKPQAKSNLATPSPHRRSNVGHAGSGEDCEASSGAYFDTVFAMGGL